MAVAAKAVEQIQKALPTPSNGPHDLKNCFDVILRRKKLVVKRDELEAILKNNLNVNTEDLNTRLANVLADALVHYMKLWPGWSRSAFYFTGKLSYDDWFERFRQYLMYKMNYIIREEDELLKLAFQKEDASKTSVGCQTDPIKRKDIAPYTIKIKGQPSVLNNLIFLQRGGELYGSIV